MKNLRNKIKYSDDELGSNIFKAHIAPLHDKCIGMRTDMMLQQVTQACIPISGGEIPRLGSSFAADILGLSSTITEIPKGSKIKLLDKIVYQNRTIYIYELDGKIDVEDSDGFYINNKIATIKKTDLDLLEENKEYTIDDSFYLKYPNCFDPVKGSVSLGANLNGIYTTMRDLSLDSCAIHEDALEKFASLRIRTSDIILRTNVFTPWQKVNGKLLPEIGEVLDRPDLISTLLGENRINNLSHTSEMPKGVDYDTLAIDTNTIVHGYEVYCINEIANTELEEARLELLSFREKVFNSLSNLPESQFTDRAKRYKENFQYNKFFISDSEIKKPLVRFTLVTVSVPEVGTKLTNMFGAKATIQRIIRKGDALEKYIGENGEKIDIFFGGHSLIGRTISAPLYEIWFTSIFEFIHNKCRSGELDPLGLKEFLNIFFESCDQMQHFKNIYKHLTDEDVYNLWKDNKMSLNLKPFNTYVGVQTQAKLLKFVESLGYDKRNMYSFTVRTYKLDEYQSFKLKYPNYPVGDIPNIREFMIINNFKGLDIIDRTSGIVTRYNKILHPEKQTVGSVYIMKLLHDPFYQTSVSGVPEKTPSGAIAEDDDRKREGRTVYSKKNQKTDVQATFLLLNTLNNNLCSTLFNDEENKQYAIVEKINSVGIDLSFAFSSNKQKEE